MWRHMHDQPLLVYGTGEQQRAFTFIGDIVAPLYRAATLPAASKQTINLGGSTPVTIRDAAETLCGVLRGGRIEHREPRHEVQEAWCTTQKSIDILGYDERTTLRAGLREMWQWAQSADHRCKPPQEIDLLRGVPEYWL